MARASQQPTEGADPLQEQETDSTATKEGTHMIKSRLLRAVSLISLVILGGVAVLSAQSGSAPSPYAELLAEVRGLRADLAKSAGVSGRIQLLSARLSIQEQRLGGLSQQLIEVRDDLARTTSDRLEIEARLEQVNASLTRAVPIDPLKDAADLRSVLINRLSGLRDRESQLRAHESEVSAQVTSEERQRRDFNSRLDDLERSLAGGK
jgi:chromosome segregation ATPase